MNKKTVIDFLDRPSTILGRTYSYFVLLLIVLTVIRVVIEEKKPGLLVNLEDLLAWLEFITLFVFTIEYVLRILCSDNRLKYIFSFHGLVDAVSVIPGLIGLFGPDTANMLWVRVAKIFRLVRVLKVIRTDNGFSNIIGRLLPYLISALAFKALTLILENQPWWPELTNLNIVIGVVGFALAILLGTKLSLVNNRIYAIEDAVCRIVGSMQDMQNKADICSELREWSLSLERTLTSPAERKPEMVQEMREQTVRLECHFEEAGIGGPNTAGFHRDVSFLLHRATTETHPAYEQFLKYVTISYIAVVILAVPGLTGFVMSALVVYVLGGMFILIDDMDNPLNYSEDSFIDVSLDALEFYNRSR